MKKLVLLLAIYALTGFSMAYAQAVSNLLQQRIQTDQQDISLDRADIQAKKADIDSIVNDQTADAVTADVPAVVAIQATQAAAIAAQQPVSPAMPAPAQSMDVQTTLSMDITSARHCTVDEGVKTCTDWNDNV